MTPHDHFVNKDPNAVTIPDTPPSLSNAMEGSPKSQNMIFKPFLDTENSNKPLPQRQIRPARKRCRTDRSQLSDSDVSITTHTQDIGTSPINTPIGTDTTTTLNSNDSTRFWSDPLSTDFQPTSGWLGDDWQPNQATKNKNTAPCLTQQPLNFNFGAMSNARKSGQSGIQNGTSRQTTPAKNNQNEAPSLDKTLMNSEYIPATKSGNIPSDNQGISNNLKITLNLDTESSNHPSRSVLFQKETTRPLWAFRPHTDTPMAESPATDDPQTQGTAPVTTQQDLQSTIDRILREQAQPQVNQNVGKQVYFAHILPQALEQWRLYRSNAQKAAFCTRLASFLRHLATSKLYPSWSVSFSPPPGTIQTSIDAIKLVNIRRDFSSTAILTVASILDDHSVTHRSAADEAKTKMKKRYEEQVPTEGHSLTYSYNDAKELAANVIERDCAGLNKRLQSEEARLVRCPDAALWVGVPIALVPGNIVNLGQTNRSSTQTKPNNACTITASGAPTTSRSGDALAQAPPAEYSDIAQIGHARQRHGLDQVSPLVSPPHRPTQGVFSAAWGPPPKPKNNQRRQQTKGPRSTPYQGNTQTPGNNQTRRGKKPKTQQPRSQTKGGQTSKTVTLSTSQLELLRSILGESL